MKLLGLSPTRLKISYSFQVLFKSMKIVGGGGEGIEILGD